MIVRRSFLLAAAVLPWTGVPALALDAAAARDFIAHVGQDIAGVVNGADNPAQKRAALAAIVDRIVDVNGIARFCLGRFWRLASPAQRQAYLTVFHKVLLTSVTGKVGEYVGMTFTVGRAMPRGADVGVQTVVTQPNQAPANVEWLVGDVGGAPRIIDVIAEGTSLRITQRSDYDSFITHNSVQALIQALQHRYG